MKGIPPGYEEKHFTPASKQGQLRLIASSDGRDDTVLIHQNACIYAGVLGPKDQISHDLAAGRTGYVHVIRGAITVNGIVLSTGDALKLTDEALITLAQADAAEVLVFDLPY